MGMFKFLCSVALLLLNFLIEALISGTVES